jgi:hypothetical protein
MEVHHHPHVPNNPKPWKEYLLEGLMIFIAVTLGYGAENIREHYINKHKGIIRKMIHLTMRWVLKIEIFKIHVLK